MQIKETIGVSLPGSVEGPPLEDVVVLVDSAGVALGVQRAFSARVRGVCDGGSGLIASKCVEIPLVGSNGEVSGILCHTGARSDTCGAVAPHRRERVRAIADVAQLVGAITVAARNVEPSADAARGFVEIVVADNGEGMPEEILSQAFTLYFTTKAAGSGTGLGFPQIQRFAEGRGGAVCIDSERDAGTPVHLFLPRVHAAGLPSSIVGTEIAYTPSANGGVFHIVNPATAAPTS
jgi:Histidine kinase-, DNA gyrase B-, and HSP90-like ATPase